LELLEKIILLRGRLYSDAGLQADDFDVVFIDDVVDDEVSKVIFYDNRSRNASVMLS
jgi:hypothetical protein